ncbi:MULTISPECIES: DUF4105 domain-containing protein [unclassified Acinetobacter]|uniref:Lnb N-terminal periplasmic domain-containing protein n=1 Tax=unclassified Acinetobacter TaxID=196816 RepID=UPI002447EC46|nr:MULTISPECIES: DUF4105 domain-containing protein [unclassified Acinetobacter]MDH0031062.1 DUF4105 domain-containing protein [Acinetobacter sp. GD04021]MDH0886648.1 DUF4105 domain-containing protein [Acinetobacter sp. GD03873]MDH1083219.1 DUF4105 domain-containing protein [Acinetobacter sp. GD03983]MDH2189268.1 DUF4105 domain-containing protein [Acinetobacter sp. GD03645]MDH2202925.1 DUF4105 domain-containing protein [Acinetobacter sp. GD03647]
MHNIGSREFFIALWIGFLHSLFALFVILSSIWLCLALWIQQPLGTVLSRVVIVIWGLFALSLIGFYVSGHLFSRRTDIIIYCLVFACSLGWYFSLDARQDRDWNPEVAEQLSYEKHGDLVTLHKVRNFDWHEDGSYDIRWEDRHIDLNKITGVNVITSYWMGPQIAHTLVSFDFSDQKPLVFSIEIRKEKGEEFSAIGGFFRKYELSLVASDEKDIVYTRSNIRHEQVYLFPIRMPATERKALFIEYLDKADELRAEAKWYNTLTSNCTTLVFDMVQAINPQRLPKDYRLLASGYLPNYLYDLKALDQNYNMKEWYQMAHINTRTADFGQQSDQSSEAFSRLIRTGLPKSE